MSDEIKFNKFEFNNDFFEVSSTTGDAPQSAEDLSYAEGVEAGKQQTLQEMTSQAQTHFKSLEKAIAKIEEAEEAYLINISNQVNKFLQITLNTIIGNAAEKYPQEVLDKHLREVIPSLPQGNTLTLHFHPDAISFHEKLGAHQAEIQGKIFSLQTDSSLAPGDCVVTWDNGGVEAKLDNAKEALTQLLNSTLPNHEAVPDESAPEKPQEAEEKPEEPTEEE